MNSKGTIKKVAGPLVIATGMRDANMFDVVHVSDQMLTGEIIEMHGDEASIQVYEETSGLGPGEPVVSTGVPMSVELGPGLITSIYDGIQRPLDAIMKVCGNNLKRGIHVDSLDREKKWNFVPTAEIGEEVSGGDGLGTLLDDHLPRWGDPRYLPPPLLQRYTDGGAGTWCYLQRAGDRAAGAHRYGGLPQL